MDILLWYSLNQNDDEIDLVKQSVTLDDFNVCFGGTSLFHHFANRDDILEYIMNLRITVAQGRPWKMSEYTLPLQIINPDLQGNTSLFMTVKHQNPKSFEIMVDMLKGFEDRCTSRMILKSLNLILSSNAESVLSFLESAIFRPPSM